MTMTMDVARMRVARNLYAAEAALDEALMRQSELLTSIVEVRLGANIAPFTGQEALMRLAKLQQSMLSAGGDLARVHGRLQDIGRELCGDTGDPTPPSALAEGAEATGAAPVAAPIAA